MADDTDIGRQIAENARRCEELARLVAGMSITEASQDGTVRVTVSANGVLTDVVLTERRQFVPMAQVSTEIMRCVRRAQARIPGLMRQAMVQTMGTPDAGAQQVLDDVQARFPAPPPESPMPRGHPARQASDDLGDSPTTPTSPTRGGHRWSPPHETR